MCVVTFCFESTRGSEPLVPSMDPQKLPNVVPIRLAFSRQKVIIEPLRSMEEMNAKGS